MTSTTYQSQMAPRERAQAAQTPTTDSADWPPGLTIMLFLLGTFAATVSYILYLASQMPH